MQKTHKRIEVTYSIRKKSVWAILKNIINVWQFKLKVGQIPEEIPIYSGNVEMEIVWRNGKNAKKFIK